MAAGQPAEAAVGDLGDEHTTGLSRLSLTRRGFLLYTAALGAGTVTGCHKSDRLAALLAPTIVNPVFASIADVTQSGTNVRLFYPSLDSSGVNAAYSVGAPFPVIVFFHGQNTSHLSWNHVGIELARSGFIVVIPELTPDATDTNVVAVSSILANLRADPVFGPLTGTTVGSCGHSLGGGDALAFTANPQVRAFASLAGALEGPQYRAFNGARLFFLDNADLEGENQFVTQVRTDTPLWTRLPIPKHHVLYKTAHHFDFIPTGAPDLTSTEARGPCGLTPNLTADLLCAFFSKYMGQQDFNPATIPDFLLPAGLSVGSARDPKFRQDFLTASDAFWKGAGPDCATTITYETSAGSGVI